MRTKTEGFSWHVFVAFIWPISSPGWKPRDWGGREDERQQEQDRLLQKAVNLALDPSAQIRLVLIAGDLFETHHPPADLVAAVLAELNRLVKAGIPVVTVPGNHDELTYHDSVYRRYSKEWPGLLVTNPMPERIGVLTIDQTPCYLYSLAYTGGLTRAQAMLREFPRGTEAGLHLAIFHGSLDWAAGERSLPLSAQGLYDRLRLCRPGVHQHQVKTVSNTVIVYPGMVEGKNLSDPGTGFFTQVELGEGLPQITKLPAEVRPYRRLVMDVTGLSETELRQELGKMADPEGVVELSLHGAFSFLPNLSDLAAWLRQQFYYCEVRDETALLDQALIEKWAGEPTLRGAFLQRMLKRMAEAANPQEEKLAFFAMMKGLTALQRGKEDGKS